MNSKRIWKTKWLGMGLLAMAAASGAAAGGDKNVATAEKAPAKPQPAKTQSSKAGQPNPVPAINPALVGDWILITKEDCGKAVDRITFKNDGSASVRSECKFNGKTINMSGTGSWSVKRMNLEIKRISVKIDVKGAQSEGEAQEIKKILREDFLKTSTEKIVSVSKDEFVTEEKSDDGYTFRTIYRRANN